MKNAHSDNRVVLRAATIDDATLLFGWVNHNDSLSASLETKTKVNWINHLVWLNKKIVDDNTRIWIVELERIPVGQIRVERTKKSAVLSIYLDPSARGSGAAHIATELVTNEILILWPRVPIIAKIIPENLNSIRFFRSAGFILDEEKTEYLSFAYKGKNEFN